MMAESGPNAENVADSHGEHLRNKMHFLL